MARDSRDRLLCYTLGNNFQIFLFNSKQGVATHGILQNYLKRFVCIRVYSFVPLLYSIEDGHRSVVKTFGLIKDVMKIIG